MPFVPIEIGSWQQIFLSRHGLIDIYGGRFVEMPAEKMRCANMHLLAMNKLDTKLPAAPIDPDTLLSRVENEGESEGAVQG